MHEPHQFLSDQMAILLNVSVCTITILILFRLSRLKIQRLEREGNTLFKIYNSYMNDGAMNKIKDINPDALAGQIEGQHHKFFEMVQNMDKAQSSVQPESKTQNDLNMSIKDFVTTKLKKNKSTNK